MISSDKYESVNGAMFALMNAYNSGDRAEFSRLLDMVMADAGMTRPVASRAIIHLIGGEAASCPDPKSDQDSTGLRLVQGGKGSLGR